MDTAQYLQNKVLPAKGAAIIDTNKLSIIPK
jgi:hypothetical protein